MDGDRFAQKNTHHKKNLFFSLSFVLYAFFFFFKYIILALQFQTD